MPLTVLSDSDVNRILHSFTKEDVLALQETLADALHWYSTSNDANDCCSDFQPERTHLKRKDGSTTLFMPASGLTGQGIKVVNIVSPESSGLPALAESLSLNSDETSRSSLSDQSTRSPASHRDSFSTVSTTASSTNSSLPATASVDSASTHRTSVTSGAGSSASTIRGSLTLMDNLGNTTGLINAEEVTAFRTALASTMLLRKRHSVHDVTVFGAGKQAYWHIRLAMLLRPDEIHHMNIVTRNFESARSCIHRLYNPLPDDPDYENPIGSSYNSKLKKNILTPMYGPTPPPLIHLILRRFANHMS